MSGPRILSLLPSATEIVYALGLDEQLVGVTHECDWPPPARSKPRVTRSLIPAAASAAEIDELVSASMTGGAPTYELDEDAVRGLAPDIVLTQDLCAVCAVAAGDVDAALGRLECRAEVVSLDPSSIGEMLDGIRAVGERTGRERAAGEVVAALYERLNAVEQAVIGRARPRTFALEWGDPPYNGGHWVPEMEERAGGEALLGSRGTPSVRLEWERIAGADPQVVVFMPCGYDLDGAVAQAGPLLARDELAGADVVAAVDASGCFSRPGPRLVDGVETLAALLHPDAGIRPRWPAVRLRG